MEYLITLSVGTDVIKFRRPGYEEMVQLVEVIFDSVDDICSVKIEFVERPQRF